MKFKFGMLVGLLVCGQVVQAEEDNASPLLKIVHSQVNYQLNADGSYTKTEEQIIQLARVVDELGVPVMAYGLRTDFMGRLFPGSEALMRFADEIREARSVCWCGKRATMILRTDAEGRVLREGASILVIGRPITQAADPKDAARRIAADIGIVSTRASLGQ